MTTLLDALGQYLPTITASLPAAQQLTLGENLFLARFPAEAPNACVLVQQYPGGMPTFTMGSGVSVLETAKIQLLIRGEREDYPDAYDLAYALRNLLGAVTGTVEIDGLSILRIEPMGLPNPIGWDETDRPKFTVNFTVTLATP